MSTARIALPRPFRRRTGGARGARRTTTARAGRSRVLSGRTPRVLLALVLAAALAGGGYLWVRESSLVAVNDITITGLTGPDAPRIRAALASAASDMTTLHVRMDQLRTAVQPYPVVKDIRVTTDMTHGMRIDVIEHVPVATLEGDGERTLVAADGTLLRGRLATGALPVIAVTALPGGARVTEGPARSAVLIAAGAPPALRPLIQTIGTGASGVEVRLADGPKVLFGDGGHAAAKWAAAARVLADPDARGAAYVDVRVSDRPVAGRFAPGAGVVGATAEQPLGAPSDAAQTTSDPAAGGDGQSQP